MFANPLGLLALLAIPAILTIHFLQRKSITIPISTLFLLERTQREAVSGRRFERLLPSVPLWMQILAVLLIAWLLSEPRFQKENSVQRVAIVIDASASMQVFKKDAIQALKSKLPDLQGSASKMEIILLSALPGTDRIYSGESTEEMLAALEKFTPNAGVTDPSYALRLARSIVSNEGILIYLTDTPLEKLPYEARLISVGRPVENVGFTGVSFENIQGALTFRAIVRNYGTSPASRTWSLVTKNGRSEPRAFDIKPGAFTTIQAAFPENAQQVRLELNGDEFLLDDVMPMVAPQPKELKLFAATSPAFRDLSEKLLRSLAATSSSNDATASDLVITSYDPLDPVVPQSNAILFVEDPSSAGKYLSGGILAEAHPLMDGINWQALLVRETLELPRAVSDRVLLWQEKRPLIFLREEPGKSVLCFNFDLRLSNATQQPAFIVLLHRFAETLRDKKIAPQKLNLETSQPIQITSAPEIPLEVSAVDPLGNSLKPPAVGFAPAAPGYITMKQGGTILLEAAAQFADTREADLSKTAPSELEAFTNAASLKNHTTPDPLTRLWILVLLLALIVAWYFSNGKVRQGRLSSDVISDGA
ncbi:MAG: BatA domain-containing protein [Verrucomicrobiota bacterium]